jgi:hypothetical protein
MQCLTSLCINAFTLDVEQGLAACDPRIPCVERERSDGRDASLRGAACEL